MTASVAQPISSTVSTLLHDQTRFLNFVDWVVTFTLTAVFQSNFALLSFQHGPATHVNGLFSLSRTSRPRDPTFVFAPACRVSGESTPDFVTLRYLVSAGFCWYPMQRHRGFLPHGSFFARWNRFSRETARLTPGSQLRGRFSRGLKRSDDCQQAQPPRSLPVQVCVNCTNRDLKHVHDLV